jgi:hypothetical protein
VRRNFGDGICLKITQKKGLEFAFGFRFIKCSIKYERAKN